MLTLSERDEIRTEYQKGEISTAELAEMWFVSKSTIKNIVKGIKNGNEKFGKKLSVDDLKLIEANIDSKEITQYHLAIKLGVYPSTITHAVKRIRERINRFDNNLGLTIEDFE